MKLGSPGQIKHTCTFSIIIALHRYSPCSSEIMSAHKMSKKYPLTYHLAITEADYAHELEKTIQPVLIQSGYKPDGWLRKMVGRTFIDFSKNTKFNRGMEDLINVLGDQGKSVSEILSLYIIDILGQAQRLSISNMSCVFRTLKTYNVGYL